MGKKVELSIETDPREEEAKPFYGYFRNGELHRWGYDLCELSDFEVRIVRLESNNVDALIETVYTDVGSAVEGWLRYIDSEHRHRRAPLLACVAYYTGDAAFKYERGRGKVPAPFKKPIRYAAICVGGSHCLVHELGDPNDDYEREDVGHPFRRILENRRIGVVGIGMEEFAKHAKEQWGVEVAKPVDLEPLLKEAAGEGKVWKGMEVEKMAEEVLEGMKLRKKPKRMRKMLWLDEKVKDEELKYLTSDAYLAFEVGKKCFEMVGRQATIGE